MTMDKLKKCRICLAENVRLNVVADKNLQEIYEKLTDVPFVTEDRRPMLSCSMCYFTLKQCYQLRSKCLEAEELFAQLLNDNYETKPLINQALLECRSGYECGTERIFVKEELLIEPKEEHQSDELEPENVDSSCLDEADIPPHHSESDLEDDVPLLESKIEVEEEQVVFKNKRRASETTSTTFKCNFSRMLVFDTWLSVKESKNNADRGRRVFQTLTQQLPNVVNLNTDDLENRISYICTRLAQYWKAAHRSRLRIVEKYSDWLNESEVCCLSSAACNTQQLAPSDLPSTSGLSYRKDFTDSCKRSRRRRLAEVDDSAVKYLLSESDQSNTSSMALNTDEVLSFITEAK